MKKLIGLSVIALGVLLSGNVCNAETMTGADAQIKATELVQTLENIKDKNTLNTNIVNVVSGLNSTYEPTFDTYRIISGEAKEGSQVSVWKYGKSDNKVALKQITVHKIGASETFFDLLELSLGKNYVMIQGRLGNETTAKEYCLNRKNGEIKQKLKAMPMLFNYNKSGLGFLR